MKINNCYSYKVKLKNTNRQVIINNHIHLN